MAATQIGTGSLTVGGQATIAATYITVPSGAIVESVTVNPGGSVIFEDQMDADGALHTRIVFEAAMTTAQVVLVGVAYSETVGAIDATGYFVDSVSEESSKGPVRTTINVTYIPTA